MKDAKEIKKITEFIKIGNGVFKDAKVLSESYIPETFLFREKEIKEIMNNLTAFFDGIPPNNMFIVGPPSTGKTHIMQAVTNTLNEHAIEKGKKIRYIYINSGGKTFPQVLVDTAEKMGLDVVVNFGLNILSKIKNKIDGDYCFIFDEFDRIKRTADYSNPYDILINSFTRMGSNVRIVIIANDVNLINKLEASTKSSFSPHKLYFRPYDANEIIEILKDRCKRAFNEGVIDEETIAEFGAWIYKTGVDLRTAFKVLLTAGRNAEGNTIKFENLKEAFIEVEKNIIKDMITKLNDAELLFIHSIALAQKKYRKPEVEKNVVYSTYVSLCKSIGTQPLTWRHLSTYIAPKIEIQGLIKSEVHGRGKGRGTSTFFSIDDDLDKILSLTNDELQKRIREL